MGFRSILSKKDETAYWFRKKLEDDEEAITHAKAKAAAKKVKEEAQAAKRSAQKPDTFERDIATPTRVIHPGDDISDEEIDAMFAPAK